MNFYVHIWIVALIGPFSMFVGWCCWQILASPQSTPDKAVCVISILCSVTKNRHTWWWRLAMNIIQYKRHTVHCTLKIKHWTIDIIHWILDIIHWTLYIGHWILDIGYWTFDIRQWKLYILQCTYDIGHWTLEIFDVLTN